MNYHEVIAKGLTCEPYSMFFHVWPWIGLGAAIVLLILLFCTDVLRSDKTKSRFLDPVSLAWMGAIIYMLHNVEEYGIDIFGNEQAFTTFMFQLNGARIGEAAFLCCNLGLVWVAAPLAAVLVQKGYHRMAAGMACIELVNGLGHILQAINLGCYNPGLLNSAVLCLPVGIWTLYALYGKAKFPKIDMLWLFLAAVFAHVVLVAGMVVATRIGIPDWVQGLIMVCDNSALLLFWWLVGRKQHFAA